jgi:site-specific DNA-methyltransferase (adenine-specific)
MKPYYEHAGITIYHGDCREVLGGGSVKADLLCTDPPYVIKHTHGGGLASAIKFYRDGALDGLCDFSLADYSAVLASSDQLVAFGSRDQVVSFSSFCLEQFGHFDLHVWHKVNPIPFVNNTWLSDLEYIFLGWRAKKHAKVPMRLKSKLFQSGIDTENLHPTQKPVALMGKYLRVLNPSSVLDPFMGSGTTLVAAKALGLPAVGVEREEKYCEVAAMRLAQEVFDFTTEK